MDIGQGEDNGEREEMVIDVDMNWARRGKGFNYAESFTALVIDCS